MTFTLPATNTSPQKIGQNPIGNDRLPTIHFSGAMSCQFQGKANHQHSLVGGFNPFEKILVKMDSSSTFGVFQ